MTKTSRKLFHLYLKKTKKHKYYGSLTAVLDHNSLDVSRSTFDRHDWDKPYDTPDFELRKGHLLSSGEVRRRGDRKKKGA